MYIDVPINSTDFSLVREAISLSRSGRVNNSGKLVASCVMLWKFSFPIKVLHCLVSMRLPRKNVFLPYKIGVASA